MSLSPNEIHRSLTPQISKASSDKPRAISLGFGAAIVQIIALDVVFSFDSILTAVGMTEHMPVMVIAVVFAVSAMLIAADPLAEFIGRNPTVVMLALGFLLMIGMVLVGEGFGAHVPKGYIYTAMAFSAGVECLNIWSRRAKDNEDGSAVENISHQR